MTAFPKISMQTAQTLIETETERVCDDRLVRDPLVSVCMITFNHCAYISQALESVLAQTISVPVEIVIGDDCSDDGTTELILEFQKNHPETVTVLLAKQNLGCHTGNGRLNFLRTLSACRGKYIAFLEGDDYWTDPSKLQKQLEFLERHPNFVLCFHNAQIHNIRSGQQCERRLHEGLDKDVFETRDLLRQWFIPTASIVFQKPEEFEFPEWFLHTQSGDIPLLLLLSLRGPMRYLDEVMSVYRLHDEGLSTGHSGHRKAIAMAFMYQSFNIETNYQFDGEIRDAIVEEFREHLPELRQLRKLENSFVRRLGRALTWPLRLLARPFRNRS